MGRTIDWLEPAKWDMVDRELCNLMDRSNGEVRLEVVFADREPYGGHELICSGFRRVVGWDEGEEALRRSSGHSGSVSLFMGYMHAMSLIAQLFLILLHHIETGLARDGVYLLSLPPWGHT